MKLKFLTVLMGLVVLVLSSEAQDSFTFQNLMRDTVHVVIDPEDVKSHFLGDELAVKYYRIQETYTYVEEGNVSNPASRTVVKKPNIYYSIKKLNSYYKKRLKKGDIDSSAAVEELGKYLDIGFVIYEQNTDEFENALKSAKKPDQIADLFAQVILE